ncbi:hypothetical protein H6P81_008528 [Aristolochia fimbriata]|uniref:Transcription factor CBF/NF-Y/archaeal histone domain-containing protein n=1 Tax=Aristolochia fimbriata TaxID=158543 RepID=A0AAV7EMT6_ARIFI|nr:hypothetical protein H6P81_008528 [Aristolochia fimbriata]
MCVSAGNPVEGRDCISVHEGGSGGYPGFAGGGGFSTLGRGCPLPQAHVLLLPLAPVYDTRQRLVRTPPSLTRAPICRFRLVRLKIRWDPARSRLSTGGRPKRRCALRTKGPSENRKSTSRACSLLRCASFHDGRRRRRVDRPSTDPDSIKFERLEFQMERRRALSFPVLLLLISAKVTHLSGGIKISDPERKNPSAGEENNNSNANAGAGAGADGGCLVREQDRFMPIANVIRIMRKVLPTHAKISDDAKETIQECVSEYISFITSEANERCQREQRKTITAEDVLWAMNKLGFDDYVEPLSAYLQRYRELEGDHRGAVRGEPLPKRQLSDVVGVGASPAAAYPPGFHMGPYAGVGMNGYYRPDASGSASGSGSAASASPLASFDPYAAFK